MNKNTMIAIILLISSMLVGCIDGRHFSKDSAYTLSEVEKVLDTAETRDGKSYPGLGGGMLHEMRYARTYKERKFYPVGDHYSVKWESSAKGILFSVARDH